MPPPEIRVLRAGDEPALLRFLEGHPHTTMFLRANLRKAGIEDHGEMFQGTYVGAWVDGRVVAAAVHNWNGDLHIECAERPSALEEVARFAVESSRRRILGFLGPWEQVCAARSALGCDDRAPRTLSREDLFALDLEDLRVPEALTTDAIEFRSATAADIESPLTDWRLDYEVENLGGKPSEGRSALGYTRVGNFGLILYDKGDVG